MIRNLARNAAIYAVGSFASRATALLLVPIYTYHLSVTDYGILETALVTCQILIIAYNVGLSQALVRYWQDSKHRSQSEALLGSTTAAAGALGATGAVLTVVVGWRLAAVELGDNYALAIATAVAGASLTRSWHTLLTSVYRADERPGIYVTLHTLAGILWLGACYLLLVVLDQGVIGALWSQGIGFGIVAAGTFVAVCTRVRMRVDPQVVRKVITFGAPLILSMTGWFLMNAADRYFLLAYRTAEEVGQYSLGYRVASLHTLAVVAPLQLALGPVVFALSSRQELGFHLGRIASFYAWALGLSMAAIAMLAPLAVGILAPTQYAWTYVIAYWILPASLFHGAYYWGAALLHLRERTRLAGQLILVAGLLDLVLNRLLIPAYGWLGAAMATDIAMLLAGGAVVVAGLRLQPVYFPRLQLLVVTVITVALFVVAVLGASLSEFTRYTVFGLATLAAGILPWRLGLLRPLTKVFRLVVTGSEIE